MAEEKSQAPKDLMGFLDYWLVKKAPFQIPEGGKEWIVKWGPWINLVLIIWFLLSMLATYSLFSNSMLGGFFGYPHGTTYWLSIAILVAQFILQAMALPGLFARKIRGWTLLFYSETVSIIYGLVTGNFLSVIVGALVGFYVLFQIRAKYRA